MIINNQWDVKDQDGCFWLDVMAMLPSMTYRGIIFSSSTSLSFIPKVPWPSHEHPSWSSTNQWDVNNLDGCSWLDVMAMLPSMTYKEIFFSLSASLSFIPGSLAPSGSSNMSFNISLTSVDFTLTSEMLKLMNRTSCNSDGTFYFTSAKVWTNPLPSKSTQSVNRWEWGEVINWYLWRLRAIRSPGPFRIFIPQ